MRLLNLKRDEFPFNQKAENFVFLDFKRPTVMVSAHQSTSMNVLEFRRNRLRGRRGFIQINKFGFDGPRYIQAEE